MLGKKCKSNRDKSNTTNANGNNSHNSNNNSNSNSNSNSTITDEEKNQLIKQIGITNCLLCVFRLYYLRTAFFHRA